MPAPRLASVVPLLKVKKIATVMVPLNPERTDPLPKVSVSTVSVPVPESVPFKVIWLVPSPVPTVGLAPRGRLQLLLMVLMLLPVFLIFTALKVTLLQETIPLVPSKVTVPELWVKVGVPVIVKDPAMVVVALVEVKIPPERVKASLMSIVELPPAKVPPAWI